MDGWNPACTLSLLSLSCFSLTSCLFCSLALTLTFSYSFYLHGYTPRTPLPEERTPVLARFASTYGLHEVHLEQIVHVAAAVVGGGGVLVGDLAVGRRQSAGAHRRARQDVVAAAAAAIVVVVNLQGSDEVLLLVVVVVVVVAARGRLDLEHGAELLVLVVLVRRRAQGQRRPRQLLVALVQAADHAARVR
jgi:hypothetical protein